MQTTKKVPLGIVKFLACRPTALTIDDDQISFFGYRFPPEIAQHAIAYRLTDSEATVQRITFGSSGREPALKAAESASTRCLCREDLRIVRHIPPDDEIDDFPLFTTRPSDIRAELVRVLESVKSRYAR